MHETRLLASFHFYSNSSGIAKIKYVYSFFSKTTTICQPVFLPAATSTLPGHYVRLQDIVCMHYNLENALSHASTAATSKTNE